MGALSFAFLLSSDRPSSSMVATFSRPPDSDLASGISGHVLLLPQGLLPRLFLDPPACAVSEGGKHRYRGETAFPFVLQNLHRYFLYVAFLFLFFLWRDAFHAFFFEGNFGIGVGTLVLLFNVALLTVYAFSCHSLRHLVGGNLDCFSCSAGGGLRHTAWRGVSLLNEHHMLYAWISLITVGLTDLYVRLVASGAVRDLRLL